MTDLEEHDGETAKSAAPLPVPDDHQTKNCTPVDGRTWCRYLAYTAAGGACLKLTALKQLVDDNITLRGRQRRKCNCEGWPPEKRT